MKTYLFDFDGTLVDSMPTYVSAMLKILDDNGISYGNDIVKIITPLGVLGTAEYYVKMGLDLPIEEIVLSMKKYMLALVLTLCLTAFSALAENITTSSLPRCKRSPRR